MKKYADVHLRTNELNEFDIIDWEMANKYDITKDDIDTENVGEFIFKIIRKNPVAYNNWGVTSIYYKYSLLKNGIYKHTYSIVFDGYEDEFENPLHLFGIDGETRVKWL